MLVSPEPDMLFDGQILAMETNQLIDNKMYQLVEKTSRWNSK